jgi:hypothetical protein
VRLLTAAQRPEVCVEQLLDAVNRL